MIIVSGSVVAQAAHLDALVASSLEPVHRSRGEPGCLSHAVHRDAENPLRPMFFEAWADRAALSAHLAVLASRAFARSVGALAAEPPPMTVCEATPIEL